MITEPISIIKIGLILDGQNAIKKEDTKVVRLEISVTTLLRDRSTKLPATEA